MQKVRLGWQQKEVLKRINEHPGLSSATILKGLKRGNQPEKKLEAHGFIKNKPDDNSACHHLE